MHLSETLDVGYELLEVRTGHGRKPILRTGHAPVGTIDAVRREARDVLAKAFGADGAKKREKVMELRQRILGEWKEDGASRTDVLAFLESL